METAMKSSSIQSFTAAPRSAPGTGGGTDKLAKAFRNRALSKCR